MPPIMLTARELAERLDVSYDADSVLFTLRSTARPLSHDTSAPDPSVPG
jgi:hypothetical protein